ncbi:MAG: thioesterase [SAR202 cluster bacterium]|nr:thioesterase [SAR202 cluster bacterium]
MTTFEAVKPGQTGELNVEVTKDMTVNRAGRPGADVLSTPSLLMLMERASIEATDRLLPKGHATVGYAVDGLRHLAPTAIGGKVRVKATVTAVDGNKFTYDIEAYEGDKKIGVANHRRAAISTVAK